MCAVKPTSTAPSSTCPVCEGICPRCGIPMGPPAGSKGYVLCSPCHEVYSHAVGCAIATSEEDETS